MDWKNIAIGAPLIMMANVLWPLIYYFLNLSFTSYFEYQSVYVLLGIGTILAMIGIGALMALNIFLITFFSYFTDRDSMAVMAALGCGIPVLVVSLIFWSLIAAFVMSFWMLGCFWLAVSKRRSLGGPFSKLAMGWGAPKKATYILAIGAFLAGVMFTAADSAFYQSKVKEAVVKLSADMAPGMLGTSMTDEQVEALLRIQVPNYDSLSAFQKQNMINDIKNRLQNMSSGTQMNAMMSAMVDNIPLVKLMLSLLPVLMGAFLASMLLLYESIFVGPFCALFSLALPTTFVEGAVPMKFSEEEDEKHLEEIRRLKQEKKELEKEITEKDDEIEGLNKQAEVLKKRAEEAKAERKPEEKPKEKRWYKEF
jgi:hypothetical protein